MHGISDPADAYYNQLVRGFRSGQLNLKREVPPGLTKLADPYDPAANISYRRGDRLHDVSYYKGKLYLYFGVTPALVLFWPYAVLTGHYLFHKQAVAIFCAVGFLASVALLCVLRRRYFPEVGGYVVVAGALALGLATGVPVMLQRPEVYEAPISCAYAMVMLALGGIWCALHDPARRYGWLAAASLAYGLAVGARPNMLPGAAILLVPVLHAWISAPDRDERRWPVFARMLAAAVMPILLIGFGLMLYNYLRFDNPLEFGQHYQLAQNQVHKMPHMLSLNYFWFNFRVYFLQPIHWGGPFPFVDGLMDGLYFPPAPAGYLGIEYPIGVLTNLPLVLMALAVPLAWKKRTAGEQSVLRLYMAVLVVFFVISALTLCLLSGACLRYQVDFVPALVLLAMGGVLGLERDLTAKPWWRGVGRCAWIGGLLFSVMVNLLVSYKLEARERFIDGLDQYAHSQLKEAISSLQESLRMDPGYAVVHCDLANFLVQSGCLSEAVDQYEQALGIDPNFPGAWNGLLQAEQKLQHPVANPPN